MEERRNSRLDHAWPDFVSPQKKNVFGNSLRTRNLKIDIGMRLGPFGFGLPYSLV